MTTHTQPFDIEDTGAVTPAAGLPVDVSPEAIAALVAEGANALGDLAVQPDASPDALPLLVGITHDLRSPLSGMLVLIERLRAGHAGPLTPLQEKQLGLLYSATFGISALVNDVLDVARAGPRDNFPSAQVSFSVAELWRSVRVLVQPIAEEKRLLLRWSGVQDDARLGHPAVLHRVLLNLVTNALKYTESGSVTVSAEAVGASAVRFCVRDTGMGIPAAVRAQIGEKAASRSERLPSSGGLGIALCQQMLASMGSSLELIEDTPDTGSALGFTVELPSVG